MSFWQLIRCVIFLFRQNKKETMREAYLDFKRWLTRTNFNIRNRILEIDRDAWISFLLVLLINIIIFSIMCYFTMKF